MAPSRRQPTPNTAARATIEEEGVETTAERHARLRATILEKKQLQEIEEMERELTGGSPTSSSIFGGSMGKRPASQELTARHRRAFPPPSYKGTNLREMRDFLLGCEVYFGAVEEHDESRRVAIAASYLREEALRQWSRLGRAQPTTWTEFEQALRNMVQDPANRMALASVKLKELKQGQLSVRELVTTIEELEDEIPVLTDEEQKAWTLLNCLQPELRTAVLREEREIRTRTQVQATAQRLQELGVVRAPKETRVSKEVQASSEKRTSPPRETSETGAKKRERTPLGERVCFRCNQKGHLARNCAVTKS